MKSNNCITKSYISIVIVFLLYALIFSGCATVPRYAYANGCEIWFSRAYNVALELAPMAPASNGAQPWMVGAVDTARVGLMNTPQVLVDFGIDAKAIRSLEDARTLLTARGFERLAVASTPSLIASIRLVTGFLRSLGASVAYGVETIASSTITILVAPAGVFQQDWSQEWQQE